MNKILLAFLLLLSSFTLLDNYESEIDGLLRWDEKFGFSGAVLVVKGNKIVFSKGYGYANQQAVIPNTTKTAFYIASVSKPITAMAIMKLVELNRLSLRDPIYKFFPKSPENRRTITVEQLLNHTSGLDHTYSCDDISDRDKAIETILQETPEVDPPGTSFNYSGDNYTLLAAIIEIVSGDTFENFIGTNVLVPAGIEFQGIEIPAFTGKMGKLVPELVALPAQNSSLKSLGDLKPSWGRKGRSGMILSVEDLYKIDKAFEAGKIVNLQTLSAMLTPAIKSSTSAGYGYGFSVGSTTWGTSVFGHSGDDDFIGHNADYLNFPEDKVKIFVVSNSGLYAGTSWSSVVSANLQRQLLRTTYSFRTQPLRYNEFSAYSSESVEPLEGVYESPELSCHVWIDAKGSLLLSPLGHQAEVLFGLPVNYRGNSIEAGKILEAATQGDYSLLKGSTRDQSYEKVETSLASILKSQKEKNGAIKKIEIMGTANIWSGNYQAAMATWFKLQFEKTSTLYRMEWDNNNKIVGFGGNRLAYPLMFSLQSIAKNEFIGFDVGNGKSVALNFLTLDSNGKPLLKLKFDGREPLLLSNRGMVEMLPKRSGAEILYQKILIDGNNAAIKELERLLKNPNRFRVDEDDLNEVGYNLLNDKKLKEAIDIFTMIVTLYPNSANAFDSLGEAYLKAGNSGAALKNYKRSLELNPKNKAAAKIIESLDH